ncbi:hypothetical protein D3C86_1598580 [compost metagenome]
MLLPLYQLIPNPLARRCGAADVVLAWPDLRLAILVRVICRHHFGDAPVDLLAEAAGVLVLLDTLDLGEWLDAGNEALELALPRFRHSDPTPVPVQGRELVQELALERAARGVAGQDLVFDMPHDDAAHLVADLVGQGPHVLDRPLLPVFQRVLLQWRKREHLGCCRDGGRESRQDDIGLLGGGLGCHVGLHFAHHPGAC